jgi:para-nitrobenzyl esterase
LYDEADEALSDTMQQYWVNFVKTGNPNGEGLPEWKMRTKGQEKLLQLDTTIQMVEDPNKALYPVNDRYQESME